ncbi:TPA: GDP-L-fucose synthase [Campylobacter jejuni]|uniref:GDP-L-fucose synthase family protein n=1 Tax=Campylobacter jejuni TaxID=197 RepID=UPI000C28EEF7|nr:GDP-L-fucose synthase [Campylobacter jejuni]PJP36685.1 GDP-L-fucose synthase [Campylobacter jejuni subsp. jejuni]HEC2731740.1 GDP-L-fucose synthase [Campylobacter jejuni]HEG2281474.1 GDP-L-fucose synthase [Campylobacter jejuni]HEG2290346.1 GDP-L-fucose synthase [Campylobacter jejuni]HEH5832247.1 GDP-L-fucose synthase [Campylobacter jejuni]
MQKDSKIYIAGHSGLVGSAILNELKQQGYKNLVFKTHFELDLTNQKAVADFFEREKPEYVILAAAKAGGILANNTYRADFIYQNLMIECNVIHNAYLHKVKKLLFIASTTVYPKNATLPTNEEQMLSGDLEYTNKPYAIAKISGLMLCESYNLQYNTNFIAITPTNLYGNNDKFDLEKAHVMPVMLRKFHLAKLLSENKEKELLKDLKLNFLDEAKEYLKTFGVNENSVEIWGTGEPTREFLHSQDLAEAVIFIMENIDFKDLRNENKEIINTHINIGPNENISIKELANLIKKTVGFNGDIIFNANRPNGSLQKLTDCSKIHSLGWKAKIKLEDGIKMMYEWYLKEQNIRQ